MLSTTLYEKTVYRFNSMYNAMEIFIFTKILNSSAKKCIFIKLFTIILLLLLMFSPLLVGSLIYSATAWISGFFGVSVLAIKLITMLFLVIILWKYQILFFIGCFTAIFFVLLA